MLRAFEFAFVGVEAEKRRPPGANAGEGESLDRKLKNWLAGGGQVPPPPKEELATWLLAWMVVAPAAEENCGGDRQTDEWVVLMCGEKGVEGSVDTVEQVFAFESGDSSEPVVDGTAEGEDDGSGQEAEEDDDLPPPYEVEVSETDFASLSHQVENEGENSSSDDSKREDAAVIRPAEASQLKVSSRELQIEDLMTKLSAEPKLSARSNSNRSLVHTLTSTDQNEKPSLKPTIVRLNPRLDSLDVIKFEEPSDEWRSEDRRHFQQELRASRRDVQVAKQQRDMVEQLAQLRHTQLLKESARKMRANEQKRRDAQAVRQLIADTLEYRDELCIMETKVKQAKITARRDQERVSRQTRVVYGNTEKTVRGTIFGSRPLSKKETELLASNNRDESAVYDLHGRRHHSDEATLIATESAFESAVHKVRRLLLYSNESVDIFRRYDLDRSGTLSYDEFQRMLRENCAGDPAELTKEQSIAFFARFDTDRSGDINYSELLLHFFNWEAFLKRWQERKNATTKVRPLFLKYDHSSQGALPTKKFQLVMDYLGVTLSDIDAKLLAIKFSADRDGYIDYQKFLTCVGLEETLEDVRIDSGNQNFKSNLKPSMLPGSPPPGMKRIWEELQHLTTTQAKLHRLLRK
ncbi:unnamed protein product [Phytophthora fragariaefolia]|uniref:Unnamed protein product n=1 Tax=Phytophthora fragariaefolia TaxID=1490495 RepID=A0A9W6XJ34_9STRA|nr:unnamed protein product [Phytophthora fragariaefolia]